MLAASRERRLVALRSMRRYLSRGRPAAAPETAPLDDPAPADAAGPEALAAALADAAPDQPVGPVAEPAASERVPLASGAPADQTEGGPTVDAPAPDVPPPAPGAPPGEAPDRPGWGTLFDRSSDRSGQ